MKSFIIDEAVFLCQTQELEENNWKAEILCMQRNSGDTLERRGYISYGTTEVIAISNLRNEIQELFLIKKEEIGWRDIFIAIFKWIKGGGKTSSIFGRSLALFVVLGFASFLIFDYQKGPLLNAKKNYDF